MIRLLKKRKRKQRKKRRGRRKGKRGKERGKITLCGSGREGGRIKVVAVSV